MCLFSFQQKEHKRGEKQMEGRKGGRSTVNGKKKENKTGREGGERRRLLAKEGWKKKRLLSTSRKSANHRFAN